MGLDLGDRQLLDRYQRWRSLDTLMVAVATDGLTRLYGIPGKLPSAVRRFGMALTVRIGPLKDRLMSEARGTSGDLPLLLRGCRSEAAGVRLSPGQAARRSIEGLAHVGAAGRQALELHQLDDQVGTAGQGRLLEQRLLGADVERRHLGDGVDQHLVVEPAHRLPVDGQAQSVAEPPRLALDVRTLDARKGGGSSSSKAARSTSAWR